ncbi:MAG: Pyridoxal-dependent decarboxylase, partial [Ilumatobacteraceae bacterium]|nr:Pyridoxal-dependent decarboxylase [Ilumatobacteraceae bacterium]
RRLGWTAADYQSWSDAALHQGEAFVVPTAWNGETVLRFCFVNPLTTVTQAGEIIDSLM